MNFRTYIKRQKMLIEQRHEGEEFLMHRGEVIPLSDTKRLLDEFADLKGLNTEERLRASML